MYIDSVQCAYARRRTGGAQNGGGKANELRANVGGGGGRQLVQLFGAVLGDEQRVACARERTSKSRLLRTTDRRARHGPGEVGKMSRNASVLSVSASFLHGIVPAMILQKRQSGLLLLGGALIVEQRRGRAPARCATTLCARLLLLCTMARTGARNGRRTQRRTLVATLTLRLILRDTNTTQRYACATQSFFLIRIVFRICRIRIRIE